MAELNIYPIRSFVRIKATYTNRIPSSGVSYAPFCHFVLLKKYIVYGQGPIAWPFKMRDAPHIYLEPKMDRLHTQASFSCDILN